MLAVTLATALWGAALPAWPVWLALNVAFFNAVVARRRAAAIASVIIHWPARHRPAGYLAAPVLHRSTRICPRGRRPAGPADRTMDGMAIIEICGLPKRFGAVAAISHLSFDVERGSVTGFLGPNGAGKTTTVRILATLSRADRGQARVAGFDVVRDRREVRRRISLTGQFAVLDEAQTGEENLRMMGRLSRLPGPAARQRATELLAQFELTDAGRRRVGTYSGGMRRRLDLAASGVTIFLTTQYLEEADRLADRIAVLDAGRLVAEGTAAELKQRFAGRRLDLTCPDAAALARLSRYLGDRVVHLDPADLTVGVATDGSAAQVRAGPRPAGCRRSGPGPGYGLRRARRHPRRRFPHPDRTCNGDRSCLTP